jgi:hypothetical protein
LGSRLGGVGKRPFDGFYRFYGEESWWWVNLQADTGNAIGHYRAGHVARMDFEIGIHGRFKEQSLAGKGDALKIPIFDIGDARDLDAAAVVDVAAANWIGAIGGNRV